MIIHQYIGVMSDTQSQYMHYNCLVLLCYCVRDKDHCCVLCDVTRDLLFTWYIVHQPIHRPHSICQSSNMAPRPRPSGQTFIFGVIFFVFKSLLKIEGKNLKKLQF